MEQKDGRLTLRCPHNFHCHLRFGEEMYWTLRFLVQHYDIIEAMPNIKGRPICTVEDLRWYQAQVRSVLERLKGEGLLRHPVRIVYMIKLTPSTSPALIRILKKEPDVVAMKYYPEGATTNSTGGIPDLREGNLRFVLHAMEEVGMPFSGHFQRPVGPEMLLLGSEQAALDDLYWLATCFSGLKIVMEHVSSSEGIGAVKTLPNVWGGLTIHHALLTAADFMDLDNGRITNPHNLCMPPCLTEDDRQAVLDAALSGNPKFFCGDDTALHPRSTKEGVEKPATGIFNAMTAFPLWVELFERHNALDRLEFFTSQAGADFYRLPVGDQKISMVEKPWVVPLHVDPNGEFVPFWAGKQVKYAVSD